MAVHVAVHMDVNTAVHMAVHVAGQGKLPGSLLFTYWNSCRNVSKTPVFFSLLWTEQHQAWHWLLLRLIHRDNLQLQGNEVNFIKVKSAISKFLSKLHLFKHNIAHRELFQFPSVSELDEEERISDDYLWIYCSHLNHLYNELFNRFQDLLSLQMPDWVISPFLDITNEILRVIEEELVSLQSDTELRPELIKSDQDFCLQKNISQLYPAQWNTVQININAFQTTYLVERDFSVVTKLLSGQTDWKSQNVEI